MSIEKVEMFTVICDNCKESADEGTDYSCWNDENGAKDVAMEAGFINEDGNHYCPKCYNYNDDDELIIDKTRFVDTVKNDSWIKIKSEKDLPTESYVYWTLRRGFKYPMFKYVEVFTEEEKSYWLETYEYYQPIEKPDLPLT